MIYNPRAKEAHMPYLENEYILSRFTETRLLSDKEQSKVYLVTDNTTGRPFIQRLLPGDADMAVYRQLQALAPRNTPKIHHIIEEVTSNRVIEEYISGTRLDEVIGNKGKVDVEQAAYWVLSLCETLGQLHGANPPIIHRDIKPSNIIITDDGIPKLIDFDISRNYSSGSPTDTTALGTRYYAAPEQFGYAQTDVRTDIYALGRLMATMLTGRQLQPNESLSECGPLEAIVRKCCEIDPARRYQSIEELRSALAQIKGKRTKMIIGAVAVCLILLACYWLYRQLKPLPQAAINYTTAASEESAAPEISVALEVSTTPGVSATPEVSTEPDDGAATDVSTLKMYAISIMTDMDADVYIDGQSMGRTYAVTNDGSSYWSAMLPSGTYNAMCRAAGYPDYEFQIKVLNSKDTYSYTIYPEIGKVIDENRYTCTINTEPQGLDIYVDGEYLGQSPVLATPLNRNSSLDIAYNDTFLFTNRIGNFVLPSAPNEVNLTFETDNYHYHQVGFFAKFDSIDVNADFASEVDVYVDDVWAGRTQSKYLDLRLPPGTYNISCREKGYLNYDFTAKIGNDVYDFWNQRLTMDKSSPTPFHFYPIVCDEPIGTHYTITTTPSGADVYVDNEYYGTSPTQVRTVTPANRIFIHKEGYERSGLLMSQVKEEPVNNTFHFTLEPME
jgi:hypothetical protein